MIRRSLAVVMLVAPCLANDAIFRERIFPVLQAHCAACHTGSNANNGLSISALDDLLRGGKRGPAILPGQAANSRLIQFLRGEQSPRMPLGGSLPDSLVTSLAAAIDAMTPVAKIDPSRSSHAEWLFQKPKPPVVPAVQRREWVANPIDAFVLARLEAKNLAPSPPAGPRALLRRVYFDLIGLPPTPDEVQTFLSDSSPPAYEKVLDRLLADPRYGERWARHWLDLVRYAESDGFAIDSERPTAWRYRDYVIRSFNNDKPYDLFVKEQIAGDELQDRRANPEDRPERLVALGFLRMATWEADANFKTQLRQDFLNEITSATSSVFLGLTVGCARCHDHKYDPVPQRDFYRLQAFFAATRIDERPAAFREPENPSLMKRLARQYEDEAEAAGEEFKKLEEELKRKYIQAKNLQPDDKAAEEFRRALRDAKDATYTEQERKSHQAARDLQRRLSEAAPRYRPMAYSVSEVVPPHVPAVADTSVLAGGELANKGRKVEPGFLTCILGGEEPAKIPFAGGSSGRRSALADWIASPNHPLTARVMANRIWQHHFGEGLARTPSDFGLNGGRPSHPELLDWLAAQFIEKKWSIKSLHKLMLLSNTYRQSTGGPDAARSAEMDPDNRLLWRMNWLRLESEVLRDSILALSGRLEKSAGGPGVFLHLPDDVAGGFEFFKWFPSAEKDQLRRTIYTFQRRSVAMPMMEVFDAANMSESCARRSATTVAPQAFTLLNGDFTNGEARHFAQRVIESAGTDPDRQVDRAFWLALSRPPSAREMEQAQRMWAQFAPQDALTRLGVVLFNLNEFLYLE